jgi:alpha-galactosidase
MSNWITRVTTHIGTVHRALAPLSASLVIAVAVAVTLADRVSASKPVPSFNGLASTPYMGWNTYYGIGTRYDEATVKSVVDAIVSRGLRDAGYRYVWLDGGWWSGTRDPSGAITVDPQKWPDGMAAIADYIHARGLLAGIYTDAGSGSCGPPNPRGSYGHYQQDVDQFAAWGFDAVKVDFCGGNRDHLVPSQAYAAFSAALLHNASHRPMLFNICNPLRPGQLGYANPTLRRSAYYSHAFGPPIANSWRTDSDLGSPGHIAFSDVLRNLDADAAYPGAAGPGHWNDPDYLGPELGMTPTEAQSQFTMWAIVAAPLMLGDDVRTMSAATQAVVTNREVIAIDQDRFGAQGTRIDHPGAGDVWVKPLADGQRAVAMLNRGARPTRIVTSIRAVGLRRSRSYVIRDVWSNRTATHRSASAGGRFSASVPAHGVALYRLAAH